MASQSSTTDVAASPLGFMDRLGPNTLYFDPKAAQRRASDRDPRLVLLLSWVDARDLHIAKYVTQYRALFPASAILVVRCSFAQFLRPALRRAQMGPALEVLENSGLGPDAGGGDGDGDGDGAKLLIHLFSNGGVSTLATLWEMRTQSPEPLPRYVLVLDSCPGYFQWRRDANAIAASLPQWLAPLSHVLVLVAWVLYIPWGYAAPQEDNAMAINTPKVMKRESRRTYLYGTADVTIDWRHVERHAAEAKRRFGDGGEGRVRMEKFEGGKHVSQVRVDATRYWNAVQETWDAR